MAASPALLPPKPQWMRTVQRPVGVQKLEEWDGSGKGQTASQHAGLLFERKVKKELAELLPGISFGCWWSFHDSGDGRARRCQTDAIYFARRNTIITIFEIKKHYTTDAWWQLRHLYEPVVKVWAGTAHVNVVAVSRSIDPQVRMPEEVERVDSLRTWVNERHTAMGVMSCRV